MQQLLQPFLNKNDFTNVVDSNGVTSPYNDSEHQNLFNDLDNIEYDETKPENKAIVEYAKMMIDHLSNGAIGAVKLDNKNYPPLQGINFYPNKISDTTLGYYQAPNRSAQNQANKLDITVNEDSLSAEGQNPLLNFLKTLTHEGMHSLDFSHFKFPEKVALNFFKKHEQEITKDSNSFDKLIKLYDNMRNKLGNPGFAPPEPGYQKNSYDVDSDDIKNAFDKLLMSAPPMAQHKGKKGRQKPEALKPFSKLSDYLKTTPQGWYSKYGELPSEFSNFSKMFQEMPAFISEELHHPWINKGEGSSGDDINILANKLLKKYVRNMYETYRTSDDDFQNKYPNLNSSFLTKLEELRDPTKKYIEGDFKTHLNKRLNKSQPLQDNISSQQQQPVGQLFSGFGSGGLQSQNIPFGQQQFGSGIPGQQSSQLGNQFSQFGQQLAQQQNPSSINFGMSNSRQSQRDLTEDDIRNFIAGGATEDEILGNQNPQRSSLPLEMIQAHQTQQTFPQSTSQFGRPPAQLSGSSGMGSSQQKREGENDQAYQAYLKKLGPNMMHPSYQSWLQMPQPQNPSNQNQIEQKQSVSQSQIAPGFEDFQRQLQQQYASEATKHPFQKFATGGSVSSNYDPYLNTYNYVPPLTLSDYMDNQMPDPRYDTQGQASLPYHQQQNQYQSQSFPVFKHKAHGSSISDRDALRRLAAKNLGITPSMRGCFLR